MFEVNVKNVMGKKDEEDQLRFFSWMVTPITTLQQSKIAKHHFGLLRYPKDTLKLKTPPEELLVCQIREGSQKKM